MMQISVRRIIKPSFYLILLLAILMIIVVLAIFPWPIQPEEFSATYDPKAFVIGCSERLLVEESSVFLEFHTIDLENRKLNTTIHFHYVLENSSNLEEVFFIFQIPFTVHKTKVQFYATTPEYLGGSTSISDSKSQLSYIMLKIPKCNQTFNEQKYLRLDFVMDNLFLKKNHYDYELVLTLSDSFHDDVEDIPHYDEIQKQGYLWRIIWRNSKSARLDLERPSNSQYSLNLTPKSDFIGFVQNKTWFRWDVKSNYSGLSSSIIIDIVDEGEKVLFEIRTTLTWFLLGLLIPLFINSLNKWSEEPRFVVKPKPEPNYYPSKEGIAFYNFEVENNGGKMAYDCEVNVTFQKNNEDLFSFSAKWVGTPEPLGKLLPDGQQEKFPSLIPFAKVINLKPRTTRSFTLLIKEDDEEEFYGWNAESYFHGDKKQEWKLGLGSYIARIEIIGGNVKELFMFKIENIGRNSREIRITKI